MAPEEAEQTVFTCPESIVPNTGFAGAGAPDTFLNKSENSKSFMDSRYRLRLRFWGLFLKEKLRLCCRGSFLKKARHELCT
jgi:hypothetical protein